MSSQAKPSLLISACLLGDPVRYDGQSKGLSEISLTSLTQLADLIPICPEMAGGLPVPRAAAELQGGDGRAVWQLQATVMTVKDEDVSKSFMQGAQQALALAKRMHCQLALLMARSPSCGNQQVYDGSFSGQLVDGVGVTTALLEANGIRVFNPNQLAELQQAILQIADET